MGGARMLKVGGIAKRTIGGVGSGDAGAAVIRPIPTRTGIHGRSCPNRDKLLTPAGKT